MRKLVVLILLITAASGTALAQPGVTPPGQPPATGYQLLSPDERLILERGEMPLGQYIAGGVVGSAIGLGIGHAVQGRFLDRGWIFLLGEGVGMALYIKFFIECFEPEDACSDADLDLAVAGLIGVVGFRIWEIVDVWAAPPRHNARVRELRARAGMPPAYGLYLAPSISRGDSGGVAGLTLRF